MLGELSGKRKTNLILQIYSQALMYKLLYSFEEGLALEYFREKTAIQMISCDGKSFSLARLS